MQFKFHDSKQNHDSIRKDWITCVCYNISLCTSELCSLYQ